MTRHKVIRPPRLYKLEKGDKIIRGIRYGGKFVEIESPLSDEELCAEIEADYDDVDSYQYTGKGRNYKEDDTLQNPEIEQILKTKGLYNDQIARLAKKLDLPQHGYLGTFSIDTIHKVADLIKPGIEQFGFIFNTDKESGPGKHWIAVAYIRRFKELDYYNSLAEPPTDEFLEEIKKVVDKLRLPYLLKFKQNTIARQGASWNCGWHALLFLYKVLVKRQQFIFASGYSDIRKGEKEIKDFKNTAEERFGYI
jgi:hypothetical protein